MPKLQSKLSASKYPCLPYEEALRYLVFPKGVSLEYADPVMIGRAAALAKHMGLKIEMNSVYRPTSLQIELFKQSGGKKDANGNWVGGNGKVAVPGRSWHEYGLAFDTSSKWLKALEKDLKTIDQKTLAMFGLFKPLTKGNKTGVFEDWHIQCYETQNVPVEKRKAMMPTKVA